ncbi:MAG: hypothetical protein JETT_1084 [Candidatus Jettenia ecosi]|uniref:Uncharacterized protein n=1 Tax=Candidatus Jettenia ecosi TaxID=2494326 RepID=A0A533QPX4_9BACT|nr:MAG: hypothetical protein JETT_1084 [Candidatus Jettenia ecosi]
MELFDKVFYQDREKVLLAVFAHLNILSGQEKKAKQPNIYMRQIL